MAAPQDIVEPGYEILIDNQWEILVEARSIMILVGK
jgi:hypothetical protein